MGVIPNRKQLTLEKDMLLQTRVHFEPVFFWNQEAVWLKRILKGSNRSRAAKEIKSLQRAHNAGITIPKIAEAMQPAVMEPNTTNGLREAAGRIDQMLDIAAGD